MAVAINILFLIGFNWTHKWPHGDFPYILQNYLSTVG